ncbi:T9SS type A sorting domain-containing protein [Flavobacterium dauae]|uniref:Ig-like domain-containing protein n=1 Tax=Flavobacterium dauae TaxID=1563479 RepID=UPI00272E5FA6|nr:fibronectin type III domain-containing protein [Flavobacterium dauae]WLD23868.1 T9SS type A sorting domain-containing protein [Flavobacterium dauae]
MKKITHLSKLKIRWLSTKTLICLLFLFLPFLQLQAQTPCTIITANFTEDFESAVPYTNAPDCWTAINTASWSEAIVVDYMSQSGSNSYNIYRDSDTGDLMLISPETTNLGNGTKQIRFSVIYDYGSGNNEIEIYSLNSNTATATKTLLQAFPVPQSGNWVEYIVPLPTTTDDYFAFSFPKEANNGYASYFIDDIYYEDLSPCMFPGNLDVTNITASSADITWDASMATGVTGYYYEVRDTAGTVVDSGTTTGTTAQTTGLTPGTNYTVYIRSVCGATNGNWTTFPVTFQTPCLVVTTNFYEDFETTATGGYSNPTVPTCWSYFVATGYGYGYTSTTGGQTGRGFYTYPYSGTELFLVSPETVDLGNGTKQVRFSANFPYSGYPGTEIRVYSLDGQTASSNQTLIQTIPLTTTGWKEYIVPLPVTTDDYFAIAFYGASSQYPNIYLDDVYYEDLSPCIFPLGIDVTNVTTTSADISWDASIAAGVTGYEYEIRDVTGTVVKSGSTTGATSATITGLTSATEYFVYVRSKCGTSSGIWTTFPANFITLCDIVTGNLFEGFETTPAVSTSTSPRCWTSINTVNYSSGYVSTSAMQTGNNGYYAYRYNPGDLMLISPETVDLGNGAKQLRFSARKAYTGTSYTDSLYIYTMDGVTGSSNKTLIKTIALTASWQEYIVYFPITTDDYFAFSFEEENNKTTAIYLDDVYYEDIPPLLVNVTKTDILCNGANSGTALAVPEGGKPPYSYSWSPSLDTTDAVSNLVPGQHTVTVTDDRGTVTTASITITEPTPIVSNLNLTQVSCNGKNNGLAVVAPSGGVGPYTVLWSDNTVGTTHSNFAPGSYSVTIRDANSCVLTETFTITQPAVLATSITGQTNVSVYGGNDGAATILVTGGTAPYTYSWAPSGGTAASASNLPADTYTVTVTDANGCKTTQSVVITQPAIPYEIVLVSQTNITCNGANDGKIIVKVNGGTAPYTYAWTPAAGNSASVSNLSAGVYTLTVTDADNNVTTETYTITEPVVLSGTIGSVTNVNCNGASDGSATVTATGGTAPYTYMWSNGMTTATANNLTAGNYSVSITDTNGCTATSSIAITEPAALVATGTSTDISCFGQNDGSASVTASGGASPYTYLWSNAQTGSSINGLSGGVYTVTITDANGCSQTKSFTIVEPAFVHPPVATNQNFCTGQNATLNDIVITGTSIKWYNAAVGGTLLPATTVLTNGTTYYASQTVGTCESSTRTAVQITLGQGTPLSTTQLNVCSNTRIQNMTVDGFNYTQLKWYDSATGTTELPASQLLATQTYYVSSVTGTCISPRQAIQVTVAAAVGVPTASPQTACGNTTLNDLVVTKDPGATLRWYSSTQSMTPLANTTVVSSGTYYVQQVIGNCESLRVAVAVQVINPTAPAMTSINTCEGNTIADLNTPSVTYVWYTDNSTTTALPDTYVITPGTYYLAQEVSGCISTRTSVTVTVAARPVSPTGPAKQTLHPSKSVSDIVTNEPNVSWFASYDDAIRQSNVLPKATPVQDKTTYYGILIGSNGCGSLPLAVEVTVSLGVQELDLAQLSYYPNPADSELNISYIEDINNVEIFTITGQKVLSKEFKSREVKVDLSGLSAGTYMLRIQTEKASQFIKIIKK